MRVQEKCYYKNKFWRYKMKFAFAHNNINVLDLDASLKFYETALGLAETSRITPEDGSFIIVYLGDGQTSHKLELTWLRDWVRPVSYTHLRAHETDSYLVCRLLLEK